MSNADCTPGREPRSAAAGLQYYAKELAWKNVSEMSYFCVE